MSMHARSGDAAHGRMADTPSQIPGRGWRDIRWRTKDQVAQDNLYLVSAGVAFYVFLALFPAIAALVSVLGLMMQPADVERLVQAGGALLPPDALAIIEEQVHAVATASGGALGLSLVISVLLSFWSATAGMKGLMTAFNIVYDEDEKRGFLRYYATAILLTLGAMAFLVAALALVALLPVLLAQLNLPGWLRVALGLVRWVILAGVFMLMLAVLYRFGPSREKPKWRWVTWGAGTAPVLWLVGSGLFSLYVSNFGDYNATYGTLAAIVILLTWFYLTAFVILLGAELNAEMEHQTARDSTIGREQPLGRRGARMADRVGQAQ